MTKMWKCKHCGHVENFVLKVNLVEHDKDGNIVKDYVAELECSNCRELKDNINDLAEWVGDDE